jgi:benzoate-CoA ligase
MTMMNAAWELLRPNLERHPDKDAYVFGGEGIDYRRLREGAARFAGLLRDKGVAPGDRVVIVLPDTPAFVYAFLGAMLLGAVAVPVSTALAAGDYAFILADSGARALTVRPEHEAAGAACAGPLARILCGDHGPPELATVRNVDAPSLGDPDRLGCMLYTSGSTGKPKGVPHRHADLLVPAGTWGEVLGITPGDVVFSASKLYFAYGLLAGLILPLSAGATVVLYPDKPGAYELFAVIAERRPSVFFGVPTLYGLMIRAFDAAVRLDGLRLCVSAGEALPPVLFEEWKRLTGLELLDGIGSTEACNVFISNRPGRARAGTSGQVVPGHEVKLVGDAGQPVASGQRGHLLVRGESFARSYWNRPEKTRETMLADGFVRTGDVYVEQDGFYTHQGRSDDMIKAGAHWVSPVRIEEVLLTHPAVAEAAVAGCRVEGLERPCAFVIPKAGVTPGPPLSGDLRRYAKEKLPPYMCPVRFEFPLELPKTPTGKIQRFKLRQI